jgi:hypothetical protein
MDHKISKLYKRLATGLLILLLVLLVYTLSQVIITEATNRARPRIDFDGLAKIGNDIEDLI